MSTPVIMPKFGMTQEEGTILRWLKAEGERVVKGETLLEVQTDKVDMEVEAPASGILRDIRYGADATVPVTTVIALIDAQDEEIAPRQESPLAPPTHTAPTTTTPSVRTETRVSPVAQRLATEQGVDLGRIVGSGPQGRIIKADVQKAVVEVGEGKGEERVRATPAARRLAREAGRTLAQIGGSGPLGRIQAADVTASASASISASASASAFSTTPLRGMHKTIATRLTRSWQSIPHIFLSASVDMSQAETLRTQLSADVERAGGRLTPTVLFAKAVACALTHHPRLNAWLTEQADELALVEHAQVNLGIAVALDNGLIVPVLRDAQRLGLTAIASQLADLAQRARSGQLQPHEVIDGTFSITNLGMFPVDHFTAIINPPQVAILAVGRTQIQPLWDGVAFQPRPVLQLTLSADHRAVDGAVAAAFLSEVKQLLEEPTRMLL